STTTPGLISVESLRARLEPRTSSAWHALSGPEDLVPGQASTFEVDGVGLFVCRIAGDLFAFRDSCARCSGGLAGAVPVRRLGGAANDAVLTCPSCGAHFDVRRAGAGLGDPALHPAPLPLLVEGGTVPVALP